MRKNSIMLLVAAMAMAVYAETAAPAEEIVRVGAKGKIVLVAAPDVNVEPLNAAATNLSNVLAVIVEVKRGGKWNLASAVNDVRSTGGNFSVFVANDPAMPKTLISPSDKWAFVNARGQSPKAVESLVVRSVAAILSCGPDDKPLEITKLNVLLSMLNGLSAWGIDPYVEMPRKDAIAAGMLKE